MVVGAGPAGRGLAHRLLEAGVEVDLVDPHPDRPWIATYACWTDELPGWLGEQSIAASVDRVQVRTPRPHSIARGYSIFDTGGLQRALTVTAARVHPHSAAAIGPRSVRLDDGTDVHADVVIDCRGGSVRHAPRQTAYGVVVDTDAAAPVLDGHEALLMDWSISQDDSSALPSFLYAIPVGAGRVLLEETCLAGHPALGQDELHARLERRLSAYGIGLRHTPVHHVEHVAFPLLGASRRPWRADPPRFGADGGLKHPTTGYSVATSLRCADTVAAAITSGTDPTRALWPWQAVAVHRLRQRGLGALLRLDADETVRFFDAFFAMPPALQRSYLSDRDDVMGTVAAMSAVFASAGLTLGTRVAHGSLRRPPTIG